MARPLFNLKLDTKPMERAAKKVAFASNRSDFEIVTFNGITLLRTMKFHTPFRTGNGNAGWWPAWTKLNIPGAPSRRKLGVNIIALGKKGRNKREYTAAGTVIDNRRTRGLRSIEWTNEASVKNPRTGRQVRYLWVSNARGRSAGWVQKANDAAEFRFLQLYQKIMKKHSARR